MEWQRFFNQDERYGLVTALRTLGSYREQEPTHQFDIYWRDSQRVVIDVTTGMIVATERPTL